jgi:hypothetical protein
MTPRGGIRPWRGERAGGGARGAQHRLSALRPRAERRVAAGTPGGVVEAYARTVGRRWRSLIVGAAHAPQWIPRVGTLMFSGPK